MGHPVVKVVVPLILLGFVVASWALRPEGRVLRDVSSAQPA